MNILVLGHKGMLGHMVKKYLTDCGFSIEIIEHRYPSDEFKTAVLSFSGDYVINCIGAIPQKTKQFSVNYDLPVWLSDNCKSKVIHAGTDCEIDEDDYGSSKREARNYLVEKSKNTKIIKCSIIGPEIKDKKSLLEWFINTDQEVIRGWSSAYWSGITTLEWSKSCKNLISNWENYPVENVVESTCLTKYDLLLLISKIYGIEKKIERNDDVKFNKCLRGNIVAPHIEDQLIELKNYFK